MEKYILKKSKTPGWWVLTDTDLGLVCKFQDKCFNSTQQYTFLDDIPQPDAQALARAVRMMSDWLAVNHYDIAMGVDDRMEIPTTAGAGNIKVGAFIIPKDMKN